MNKKGFTLIELLTVIALIAIIAVITTPVIIDVVENSKEKAYNEQVRLVENAAERWGTENIQKLPKTDGADCCILVSDLKTNGYLSSSQNIKNPKKPSQDMKNVKITCNISDTITKYTYKYTEDNCISCIS